MDRQHNSYRKDRGSTWLRNTLFASVLVVFLSFCLVVGAGTGLLLAFYDDLPSLAPLDDYTSAKWNLPTEVYDRNGRLIAQFYEEKRELVEIQNLPQELVQALISIEDTRFFQHNGVDFRGIARAAVRNIAAGRIVEGGSTLTQQLAKVLFLTPKQTFRRKIKEALLALKIERNYTKREILDRYFNKIYFGAGSYGVEAASQVYFDKSAEDLTLAESALLAGLPKAPSYYSPFNNPEAAQDRHFTVLSQMADQNYITEARAETVHDSFWANYERKRYQASDENSKRAREGAYFIELIRKRLLNKFGADVVYRGGLQVRTTVNMEYQTMLEDKLNEYLLQFNIDRGNLAEGTDTFPTSADTDFIEGAVYVKDPQSGEVLATVGGHGWSVGNQLNRATQSYRQPGSAFKPILYSAALDNGYTISSKLQDRPLIFNTPQGRWVPQNYSKQYHGEVTLRTALVNSMNVASVDLMQKVGAQTVIRYAKKLGIESPLIEHKSLALGGLHHGVSLKELSNVYSVFANKGIRTNAVFIREIRDREGNVLERNFPYKREVLSPRVAAIVTDLLKSVVNEGTGRGVGVYFDRPIAGKTGTTNEFRDAWFMGYTPGLVMGTWFGYDSSNRSIGDNMTGGRVAGAFWRKAGQEIFEGRPPRTFSVPPGLNFINIDPTTGYLSTSRCPRSVREPYLPGTEPTQRCPVHLSPDWQS
jgi:penicillin-binding protein 1A